MEGGAERLIFTLGEIVGASDTVGGEVLEMTADNFRQCLARARRDLHNFMNNQCGLVNTSNPCRCPKKTRGFIEHGHVDPHRLLFVPEHFERVRDVAGETVREIEDVVECQHGAAARMEDPDVCHLCDQGAQDGQDVLRTDRLPAQGLEKPGQMGFAGTERRVNMVLDDLKPGCMEYHCVE